MSLPTAPERTVDMPSEADFGTAVPVLLIYDDDGEFIDFRVGRDIQPYLEYVASLPSDLRSHEPPRNSGEGTAVNGPMPLGEKPDAPAPT